ncbi:SidA/IucD/PvdA family monooxygenase [Pelistega sp. MC2]|uniref:SidA/IucD/PvdA family monooxygenase n=1 Tax=Pelistega sp. MC2 TaxID=1720297 RepID=UPI0008DA6342|nr:SidA/IucD/PvdA family monooxygenase [Pelistega sp. MC2]
MDSMDIIGIGIGPFNLGLSALLTEHKSISSLFLDRREEFHWHKGLLINNTTLQVPFLADLVTMANPTHKLSYLNYLHQRGRLYQFYYYDNFLIPRTEYNDYCRWALSHLSNCKLQHDVYHIEYDKLQQSFVVHSRFLDNDVQFLAKNLSIGIGTKPSLPQCIMDLKITHPRVRHSADFLDIREDLRRCKIITVIGSGQSAAECVFSLLSEMDDESIQKGARIQWITRSPGFHPMEFSKLGQECFTPAYMEYFQSLNLSKRKNISKTQGYLYKGISFTTIADIYDLIYEKTVGGKDSGLLLCSNCELKTIENIDSKQGNLRLLFEHIPLEREFSLDSDAVILATGYSHQWPDWFENLKKDLLVTDEYNNYIIDTNFSLRLQSGVQGRIFMQNADIFQQGVGAPDLGIGAYRNAVIINQLLSQNYYHIPERTSFQNYGLPEL